MQKKLVYFSLKKLLNHNFECLDNRLVVEGLLKSRHNRLIQASLRGKRMNNDRISKNESPIKKFQIGRQCFLQFINKYEFIG